ncbi:MAG: FHA domain-containing protein, partial [Isosphaeraceae bacterium]
MATPQTIVPTLQILSGPFTGRLYTLDRDVTIIGRNPECDVVLQPKSVSRKHAAILRHRGGFLIQDMGSTRGTYVNGQKIAQPVMLQEGQTIQIGELLLSFSSRFVQIQEGDEEQSTIYATIDLMNQSDKYLPMVKPEAKLRALRMITEELGGTLALNEMLDRIFNSLFEIFPRAERGFVLIRDSGSDTLVPEVIRSRTGPAGELSISKTVLNRVLNEGQAIMSKDLAKEFPESDSVSESQIRSLMCVPLMGQDRKPVGIMQIDTRDGRSRFEQEDLDLLVAVAGQISVAVQNAQLHKVLVRQREIEQELLFARQVMQTLLPERPASVPGYEFWAYYEPARHVGGDYYGFFPLGEPVPAKASSSATRWAIAV